MLEQEPSPPIACSLAPGLLEARIDEFRALFASALRGIERQPRQLSVALDAHIASEVAIRDLLRREQECCPFFIFDVQVTDGRIHLAIGVPDGAEHAIDEFEQLARSANLGRRRL